MIFKNSGPWPPDSGRQSVDPLPCFSSESEPCGVTRRNGHGPEHRFGRTPTISFERRME